MSKKLIKIAHSPDSDDAFMFYALKKGLITSDKYDFQIDRRDIEELNKLAQKEEYDITAISIHAYAHLCDKYALTASGCSMAEKDYGPMVISKRDLEQQLAWYTLEFHYGNPKKLSLGKLIFDNKSFNHRGLSDEDKIKLAKEMLQALADYLQFKRFESARSFLEDPLIDQVFNPKSWVYDEHNGVSYARHNLTRSHQSKTSKPKMQTGPIKEFRGLVWASLNHPGLIPNPDQEDLIEEGIVQAGQMPIHPDAIYPLDPDNLFAREWVLLEAKSYYEDRNTTRIRDLPLFSFEKSTSKKQLKSYLNACSKNPNLSLHYHLSTDIGSKTKTGRKISDKDRISEFRAAFYYLLANEFKFSKNRIEKIMSRLIVTFSPFSKTESEFSRSV